MPKLFASIGDPDQTPRSAVSDHGLHCLPITRWGSPDENGSTAMLQEYQDDVISNTCC